MNRLKALAPYIYPHSLNFKDKPFEAWKALGGETVRGWYPRLMHKVMFGMDVPTLWSGEARLCFVQPVSLYFDTFFAALGHEVVPFVWDCWPQYFDMMEAWLKKHKVRTAIFTSRQEMEEIQSRCPDVKMLWCPEAVDTSLYKEGKPLKERSIDLLEFGRSNEKVLGLASDSWDPRVPIHHVTTKVGDNFIYTDAQLYEAMGDAKVTICLPRSMTQPEVAGGIETLTQRYWEAMLSRMVIVGHCPKELEEIVGYNPVIELSGTGCEARGQILDIINHINDYQPLVDKNREAALHCGDWKQRMHGVMAWLRECGYDV